MPESQPAAAPQRPSASRTPFDLIRKLLRRPVVLGVGLALLFPAAAGTPDPAAAGGSCTGWGSTTVPPNSIRVYRSNSGRIETVDFRRYVLVVMGKEWGSYLPREMLEAGAQAVKQFAWYHSLAGKHRSGYSVNGQCFDVKDTTADQLYRPEGITITDKQRAAVDAIWGLSVRKSGRFILTQYRTGQSGVPCAADADGVRLFARSATKCANAGWASQRILSVYYGPGVELTWSDTNPTGSSAVGGTFAGTVTTPRGSLRVGDAIGRAPLKIAWQPDARASAIATYQIQQLVGGRWTTITRQSAADTDVAANLAWGSDTRFRVRALNSAGEPGSWSAGPEFTPRRVDDRAATPRWSGSWSRTTDAAAYRDTTTTSRQAGAKATFTFTGRAFALVGTRGPGRGRASVYVNGNLVATLDLYASTRRSGRVIFSRSWAKSATRTVEVVVVGTEGRTRVDIDAFLYLN